MLSVSFSLIRIMRKFFQKIGRIYAMEWGRVLEYRIDVIAWSLAAASITLVSLALWYNVSLQNPTGLSPQETLTYFLLVIFIKIITDAWNGFFTAWEILNGDIVKYLIRPFPMIWNDIINNTVEKCIKLLIPLPLFIFFLFSFLPFRYIVSVPAEILLGQPSFNQSIQLLLYQTVWIFLIIMLAYTLWQKGLQRYAVPG